MQTMAKAIMSGSKFAYGETLELFQQYLKSQSSEKSKNHLLYPLFQKLAVELAAKPQQKLSAKELLKIENDAFGADIYLVGQLIVEAKTSKDQWLDGFYQALHYQRKFGLTYNTIMVVAHKFVAIWKLDKLPEYAIILKNTANPAHAPNVVGKENAKRTTNQNARDIKAAATYWLEPKDIDGTVVQTVVKSLTFEVFEILKLLRNLESNRQQVNTHNFIDAIERLKPLFDQPIDAVHAFYTIVSYWDITSKVSVNDETGKILVNGYSGQRSSEPIINLPARSKEEFKRFVENQFIATNEGSGVTVDYYFSRFDEVMARIDPAYVKQHGIFFTDGNLSKFALWYAKHHFPGKIDEDYIVFDPAGGSGNLVSSWRGKLKHKIVSELQPDLLRTIERRMKADPFHIETGFTIIPKTSTNEGLNFLDRSAKDYLATLEKELKLKNLGLDKPIAFLLNPPYKNTDENQKEREEAGAHYGLHPDILELTGEDAGKERYLAFLGQILLMAREQRKKGLESMVMIFTPTSWLIPRPTYRAFRERWDAEFAYHSGFIVTSNEFFKLEGKWPLAFTIWYLRPQTDESAVNTVKVQDLTNLNRQSLNISWGLGDEEIAFQLQGLYKEENTVVLDNSRGDIRELLPEMNKNGVMQKQGRLNLYRNRTKEEKDKKIVSGFPLLDDRHTRISAPHGFVDGEYVGFMDDCTPVRIGQDPFNRVSKLPNRVWFRLDNDIKGMNKSKTFNGPADNRSYCAYDLESAKATFAWFAITKVLNGNYPIWANQYDIWPINFSRKPELEQAWYSLCFAFVLAENRCVVTKFEADNPVPGAPEVFVNNPLCPTLAESFWATTLDNEVVGSNPATQLVKAIKDLYQLWNRNYCKGQWLTNVGLKNEPYFRYFAYDDFLTPHSGLIQIRKYAEQENLADLLDGFKEIAVKTKRVREEMYRLLVGEFGYFN